MQDTPIHEQDHAALHSWMQRLHAEHRNTIGIDPAWVIKSSICCPSDSLHQEGVVWWDAEVSYAHMQVRCDLPANLMYWIVVHELFELLLWETADIFMVQSQQGRRDRRLNDYLQQTYRAARNRQIEGLMYMHLGYRRPGHMIEALEVSSSPIALYAHHTT